MKSVCLLLTAGFLLAGSSLHAQYSLGMSGLLTIPTADMQADGTFMGGGNFLPEEMTPDNWEYDTGNYFVSMTFLPFMEIGYRCTLLHGEFENGNKWQQDRSVSLRIRPLKEGRWWPSVVFGSNDAFTTGQLNMFSSDTGNRFFSSVYAVGTKHVRIGGHDLGFTFGGNIPFRRDSYHKGVFGGISYSPAFWRPLTLMAEYNTEAVSVGAAARFFNHISFCAFCYDFKAVSAGVRYEFRCWR
ncbi:YjbH domain-containing protein [Parabacteroides sp.]